MSFGTSRCSIQYVTLLEDQCSQPPPVRPNHQINHRGGDNTGDDKDSANEGDERNDVNIDNGRLAA